MLSQGMTLRDAAEKVGIDVKTARRYRRLGRLPSRCRPEHTWRTREDPFESVWDWVLEHLVVNPGLQAKTLFDDLQRKFPGRCRGEREQGRLWRSKCWSPAGC